MAAEQFEKHAGRAQKCPAGALSRVDKQQIGVGGEAMDERGGTGSLLLFATAEKQAVGCPVPSAA